MSEFFGFQKKWGIALLWSCAYPALTRTSLRVLFQLLNHRNPKTGRCNPSMERLAKILNVTRRSVQSAINELCERGAIVIQSGRLGISNQYNFPELTDECQDTLSEEKSASRSGEVGFQKVTKAASPKKGNKNINKRRARQTDKCLHRKMPTGLNDAMHEPGKAKHHKKFLNDVCWKLKHEKIPVDVLMEIDSQLLEGTYRALCENEMSRTAAIGIIIDECLKEVGRGS